MALRMERTRSERNEGRHGGAPNHYPDPSRSLDLIELFCRGAPTGDDNRGAIVLWASIDPKRFNLVDSRPGGAGKGTVRFIETRRSHRGLTDSS